MLWPLKYMFGRIFVTGRLELRTADGDCCEFGDGSGSPICISLADRWLEVQLITDPRMAVGEAYLQGRLQVANGTIYDFAELILRNIQNRPLPVWAMFVYHLRNLVKRFPFRRSRQREKKNVQHHYDRDHRLYELFLDSDLQYSCAYFENLDDDLESAQLAKKRHIASKLALKDGQKVLDIGSGWGGLCLYLADSTPANVTGITLSQEQFDVSRRRAANGNDNSRVHFQLKDFRDVEGTFDRIVSVGMLEHVGHIQFPEYFEKINALLSEDGVALVHAIGRSDGPAPTNPFMAKYIFPGGYIPALSEVFPAIEQSGLIVTDVEILRLHYAQTLRTWRNRFVANWGKASKIFGEEFCRLWEFYLAASEAAFRYENLMVFQIQLVKNQNVLPQTRGYMDEEEQRLRNLGRANEHRSPIAAE